MQLRRFILPLLIGGSLMTLLLACFSDALFRGGQFAYRDAAHYYYPLYERVQQEWNEGRWPLWAPEENGGVPLLGNPTAAVLYPGKILYALFPYAWGARLYVVAHTVLAFLAMLALMRWWGTSWIGATLSALSYAFAAPILFQYCNIIFLVGAAWIPLGFRAADRWLRCGRRLGLLELAVVLALQTLGGDPQSTYLTGVCAVGYAFSLTWLRTRSGPLRIRGWQVAALAAVLAIGWVTVVLALAVVLPNYRTRHTPPLPLAWMPWAPIAVLTVWAGVGGYLVLRWFRNRREALVVPMLAGLGGAGVLAGVLAAAQLVPVFEFTRQSGRAAGGGPHDIYPFSLEPLRLFELIWPNVYGTTFEGNRSWLALIPHLSQHAHVWIPSLYMGGLALVLAVGGLGFRNGSPWRGWLSVIAMLSLAASLGEFGSPIWWARWVPAAEAQLGPHDPVDVSGLRKDGMLRDGDGGIYWLLSTLLPGFRQFRYPSKLLTFTAFSMAGLAGLGWDSVMAGHTRRPLRVAKVLLGGSLAAFLFVVLQRTMVLRTFESWKAMQSATILGPFETGGAVWELIGALGAGVVTFGAALVLISRGARAPKWAGGIAIVLVTADLALANARYVFTVPQALMESTPEVIRLIEQAERDSPQPANQPYRIHRMPIWEPYIWREEASRDRVRDFVRWERKTIQPKYGIPYGVQYTLTMGVAELYDYEWFFGGFYRTVDAATAKRFNATPGQEFVVFPRRAFDLWNTRYFVIPAHPNGWKDEHRGFAAFLDDCDVIYPTEDQFRGPKGEERRRDWVVKEDLQILRNRLCYPRAWVVHTMKPIRTIVGMGRTEREGPMQEILFENDHLWYDSSLRVYDPKELAWIDNDHAEALKPFTAGGAPGSGEEVTVVKYESQRVELDAVLERPGLVVLADVFYPGWRLTIDGKPAPIYRANRMMRGAAVPAGRHRLVYTYAPGSVRIGGQLSLVGLASLLILGIGVRFRPVSSRLAARVVSSPDGASA